MSDKQIIFGLHAVAAVLEKTPERITRMLVLKDRQDKKIQSLLESAKKHAVKIELVTRDELDRLSMEQNHQGILIFSSAPKKYQEHELEDFLDKISEKIFLLILDGVQDPHNLGAILRTADAAGVHAVIAPKDKSVGITPTVSKVASGAAEIVPFFQVTNLVRTMEILKEKNIWIYGAASEAERELYEEKLSVSLAIVLGAEGTGLRRLTREHCDVLLRIPMSGSVSSLNVSVATGIFLFEVVRQRRIVPPR